MKDLSEGGLFVKTDKALPAGAELVIDLLPPGWTDTLRLRGIVVRSQNTPGNSGMAVHFEGNDDAKMEVVRTLVNDYQNGASPPEDAQDQLQRVLGQVAELKNALEKRDADLATERTRREEATKRAVLLTAELEIAKSSGSDPADVSNRLKELETELATSQHEEMELRTRLAELDGELAAFKHEVETLEQDDSTSRRLAAGLAKEKTDLIAENGKLAAKLKEATRLADEHAAALESRGQNERHLTEKLRVITTEVDDLRLRAAGFETRTNVAEKDLTAVRSELAAATKRAGTAEAAAKDALGKAERSRTKERELRDLMAIVTGKEPSDGASRAIEEEVMFEERTSTAPSPAADVATDIDIDMPSSPSVSISFESSDSMSTAFQASNASSIDLSVDFDFDVDDGPPPAMVSAVVAAPVMPPVVDRSSFERRLRGNEPLAKTDRFDNHSPRDDRERSVLGLLQAGGRFSELMVLGRGVVAPAELIDALFTLSSAGVIRFEEVKAKS